MRTALGQCVLRQAGDGGLPSLADRAQGHVPPGVRGVLCSAQGWGGWHPQESVSKNGIVIVRVLGMSHRLARLCLLRTGKHRRGGRGRTRVASLSSGRGHVGGGDSPPQRTFALPGGKLSFKPNPFSDSFWETTSSDGHSVACPRENKSHTQDWTPSKHRSAALGATVQVVCGVGAVSLGMRPPGLSLCGRSFGCCRGRGWGRGAAAWTGVRAAPGSPRVTPTRHPHTCAGQRFPDKCLRGSSKYG